jgi:hypothetical protein
MFGSRKILGLAATRQAITLVELVASRGRCRVLSAVELPAADRADLSDPAALGAALKDLIRRNHLSARRCVIGLQASHLAAKDKSIPLAAVNSMAQVMGIAAEQEFAASAQDLAIDYMPSSDAAEPGALLVAAPRRMVDTLAVAARAAGLTVVGVTASCVALAQAAARAPGGNALVLWLCPGGAELVAASRGGMRLLRWLPVPGQGARGGPESAKRYVADLKAELRRALASGVQRVAGEDLELLVWNAAGLDRDAVAELCDLPGLSVRPCFLPHDLRALDSAGAPAEPAFASAVALAIGGANGTALPLDFLHSRLAVAPRHRLGRLGTWAIIAGVLAVAAGVWLALQWRADQREIAELRQQMGRLAPSVKQARELADRAGFARGWFDRRPAFLNCLRETTLAFPVNNRVWATSLAVHEDMRVLLSGKAADETGALEVNDRIKANRAFRDVKQIYIRKVDATSREVSFAISYTFVGAK